MMTADQSSGKAQDLQRDEMSEPGRIRLDLERKLHRMNAFWSHDVAMDSSIPDEILIEKVLMHLDLDDISNLLRLFEKRLIKKIWKEKLLRQEPMYHGINRLYAFLLFDIKNPDRYIRNYINGRNKLIQCRD